MPDMTSAHIIQIQHEPLDSLSTKLASIRGDTPIPVIVVTTSKTGRPEHRRVFVDDMGFYVRYYGNPWRIDTTYTLAILDAWLES